MAPQPREFTKITDNSLNEREEESVLSSNDTFQRTVTTDPPNAISRMNTDTRSSPVDEQSAIPDSTDFEREEDFSPDPEEDE